MDFPRENLTRSVSFVMRDEDGGPEDGPTDPLTSDGRTIDGYAAIFDSPTRINDWDGPFDEVIARGAFTKTLKETLPVMQFNHGHDAALGEVPIAEIVTIEEDARGLHVVGRMFDNWLTQPIRDAIAGRAITGMSFRFSVVKETVDESGDIPLRTVQEVKLYELGPVVFPAYQDTCVDMRARSIRDSLMDPELRAMVARALILGTPDEAATSGTSDGAAARQEPPQHSGTSYEERERLLALTYSGVNL